MRTTVEIPDDLMTAAKVTAAQRGQSLKDLFVAALAAELRTARPGRKGRMTLPLIRSTSVDEPIDVTSEDIDAALTTVDVEKYTR